MSTVYPGINTISSLQLSLFSPTSRMPTSLTLLIEKISDFFWDFYYSLYNWYFKTFVEPHEHKKVSILQNNEIGRWNDQFLDNLQRGELAAGSTFYHSPIQSNFRWNAAFEASSSCEKLKGLVPHLFDPVNKPHFINFYNAHADNGTCEAQSLVLLKHTHIFGRELNTNADLLHKSSSEIIYLNTLKLLKTKFFHLFELHKASRRQASYFINKQGALHEARLFYFLSTLMPKTLASSIRSRMTLFVPADFSHTYSECKTVFEKIIKEVHEYPLPPNDTQNSSPSAYVNCRAWCIGNKGESEKKIQNFFERNKGSFLLSSAPSSGLAGHAIFLKINDDSCIAYDPSITRWYYFPNWREGIKTMVQFMEAIYINNPPFRHCISQVSTDPQVIAAHQRAMEAILT